jgi:hypothetical protein
MLSRSARREIPGKRCRAPFGVLASDSFCLAVGGWWQGIMDEWEGSYAVYAMR